MTAILRRQAHLDKNGVRAAVTNKGSPGTDGMTVEELPAYLVEHWEELRARLLAGTYQPRPVKRQLIPKSGGGMRELGIPSLASVHLYIFDPRRGR
jgi:RNA-directed DNA polymerase